MRMTKKNNVLMMLLVLTPSVLPSVEGVGEGAEHAAGAACIFGLACYLIGLGPRYYDLHSRVCKNESKVDFSVCREVEIVDKIDSPVHDHHYNDDDDYHHHNDDDDYHHHNDDDDYHHHSSICPVGSLYYYPTELADKKILSQLLSMFPLCPSNGRNISRYKFNKEIDKLIPFACSPDATSSSIAFDTGKNSTDFDECISHWPNAWALLYGLVTILAVLAACALVWSTCATLDCLQEYINSICDNITAMNRIVCFKLKVLGGDVISIELARKDLKIKTLSRKIKNYCKENQIGGISFSLSNVPFLTTDAAASLSKPVNTDADLISVAEHNDAVNLILLFAPSKPILAVNDGEVNEQQPLLNASAR
jgi:hypothetical protein